MAADGQLVAQLANGVRLGLRREASRLEIFQSPGCQTAKILRIFTLFCVLFDIFDDYW